MFGVDIMRPLEKQTYDRYVREQIRILNKRFCKKNPMKYKTSLGLQKTDKNKAFATYYPVKHKCVLYLKTLPNFSLPAIKGLVLHEFGHHIESQLFDIMFPWDVFPSGKKAYCFEPGIYEREMREVLADNIGFLIDKDAMISLSISIGDLTSYEGFLRLFKETPDFWHAYFNKVKKKYDMPRLNSVAFDSIKNTKMIRQMIRRM